MTDWVKNLAPNTRVEPLDSGPRLRCHNGFGVVVLRRLTREELRDNCTNGTLPDWAVEGVDAAIWNGWPCMVEKFTPHNPFDILKGREE